MEERARVRPWAGTQLGVAWGVLGVVGVCSCGSDHFRPSSERRASVNDVGSLDGTGGQMSEPGLRIPGSAGAGTLPSGGAGPNAAGDEATGGSTGSGDAGASASAGTGCLTERPSAGAYCSEPYVDCRYGDMACHCMPSADEKSWAWTCGDPDCLRSQPSRGAYCSEPIIGLTCRYGDVTCRCMQNPGGDFGEWTCNAT
jgi:hypothetical protein